MYIWFTRFSLPIKRLLDWTKWLWNQPETSSKPATWLAFNWYFQFSRSVMSDSFRPHGPQHAKPITNCRSLPKLMSIELVMPSNYLILCRPLFLLPSIFPSIRVFSNEPVLRTIWPKYWSFSLNISPSSEHSGLLSLQFSIGIKLAFNLYWILFTW